MPSLKEFIPRSCTFIYILSKVEWRSSENKTVFLFHFPFHSLPSPSLENYLFLTQLDYDALRACSVAQLLSHVQIFATRWTVAHQAHLSIEFSRQEYWSGLLSPPPGDLPDPGIKPTAPVFPELAGRFFTAELAGKPTMHCSRCKKPLWCQTNGDLGKQNILKGPYLFHTPETAKETFSAERDPCVFW